MGRLRLYTAGTGGLRHDSAGSADETVNNQIRDDFDSELLLHYDPNETPTLHCYIQLQVGAPEQFYAEFIGNQAETLLRDFKNKMESELRTLGWSALPNDTGKQVVYNSLLEDEIIQPDISNLNEKDILGLLAKGIPIDFGVPDESEALKLFRYFREITNNRSIAICGQGRRSKRVSSADIVIQYGFQFDAVKPVGQTAVRLYKREFRNLIKAAREGIFRAKHVLKSEGYNQERVDITLVKDINEKLSKFDIQLRQIEESSQRTQGKRTAYFTFLFGFTIGLVYLLFTWDFSSVVKTLNTTLIWHPFESPYYPFDPGKSPFRMRFPAWTLIIPVTSIIIVYSGSFASSHPRLSNWLSIPSYNPVTPLSSDTDEYKQNLDQAIQALEEIDDLFSHVEESNLSYRGSLSDVIDKYILKNKYIDLADRLELGAPKTVRLQLAWNTLGILGGGVTSIGFIALLYISVALFAGYWIRILEMISILCILIIGREIGTLLLGLQMRTRTPLLRGWGIPLLSAIKHIVKILFWKFLKISFFLILIAIMSLIIFFFILLIYNLNI